MKDIVIAVVRHRNIGHILSAYHVKVVSEFILDVEGHVSSLSLDKVEDVSPEMRELIKLLDEISDSHIVKQFSRGKPTRLFWENVTDDTIKQAIRPFVDERIAKALPLIAQLGLKVYRKSDRYQTINTNDELTVAPVFKCRPRFFFTLTDQGTLLYMLKVSDGVNDIPLVNADVADVAWNPAVFAAGKTLFSVSDVPFAKFRPFASKPRIVVESKFVEMYMEKIVKQSVSDYVVSAYGFDIVRRKSKPKIALRSVDSVFGFGFQLVFTYDDFCGSTVECLFSQKCRPVNMTRDANGHYSFEVMMRDFREEGRIIDVLTKDMGLTIFSNVLTIDGRPGAIDLVRWVYSYREMLDDYGIEVFISDSQYNYFAGSWDMQSDVQSSIDWFDLHITVDVGRFKIPFRRFFRYISQGENIFPLPDGTTFVIPDEWFEQWSGVIPFVDAAGADEETFRVEKSTIPLLPDFLQQRSDISAEVAADVEADDFDLSQYVNATLRPYQAMGFRWMMALARNGHGGILADDMGLGKTLQMLSLIASIYREPLDGEGVVFRKNNTGLAPTLIVMPMSLIFNWQNEIAKFTPQLSVYTYMGKNAIQGQLVPRMLGQYHIVLTSYGTARANFEHLALVEFECLVLDESHYAKNPSSKTYTALSKLSAKRHFNISGTPVENSLTDLWTQMSLVNPGLLGSRIFFEQRYRRPIELHADESLSLRLRGLTRSFILRRTKEQVLRDLPPISIQTIPCSMTEPQREIYEREKSACRNSLLDPNIDPAKRKFYILQALTRLRLIANHPSLCADDYVGGSGKTDVVIDSISSIVNAGHKMLVFSSFVRDLHLIGSRLDELGIKHLELVGSTTDREGVVSAFSSKPDCQVLLMSLKAGGVGLNLTCADYVLMLNPWWNPAAERQAYGRAHRIGQKSSVTVLRFISQGTIEQKIDDMQARKSALAQNAVEEAAFSSSDVADAVPSTEQLEEILAAE